MIKLLSRTYSMLRFHAIPVHATLVLAYHNVVNAASTGKDLYSVTKTNFVQHMEVLKRHFSVISPCELFGCWQTPSAAGPRVLITFDDGKKNNYTEALPILRAFNFPAVFFIATGSVGTDGHLSEGEIRDAAQSNIHIGSHSVTHADFAEIDVARTFEELRESKLFIDNLTKKDTVAFAYPYGNVHNIKEIDTEILHRLGYEYAFVFGAFDNYRMGDRFRIPRFMATDVQGTTLFNQVTSAFLMQNRRRLDKTR
jgi:peptidoglycan/xylan/chitin deacetylase (PgdA/CDA1 family)